MAAGLRPTIPRNRNTSYPRHCTKIEHCRHTTGEVEWCIAELRTSGTKDGSGKVHVRIGQSGDKVAAGAIDDDASSGNFGILRGVAKCEL